MALAFAREGAHVAVNYLDDKDAAERVAGEVRAAGGKSSVVQGDVSRVASVEALVDAAVRDMGGLDVLVNNAGTYPRVPFLEMRESGLGSRARRELEGDVLLRAGGRPRDDRRGPPRLDHQPRVPGHPRRRPRHALHGVQGRRGRADARHRARARAPRHPRQRDRPRPHRHRPAPLRQHGRRNRGDVGRRAAWAAWPSRKISPTWRSSSPRMRPATSRAKPSTSTAASTCPR